MTIFLCRLVIIVSLGFGIVKPRLGPLLNRWSKENAFQENHSYFQGSRHRGSLLFACQRRGTHHTWRVHWFTTRTKEKIFLVPHISSDSVPSQACLRVIHPKNDPSNKTLLAAVPLAVIDASICWWWNNQVNTKQKKEQKKITSSLPFYNQLL